MSAELFSALSKYVTETVEEQVKNQLTGLDVHQTVNSHTQSIVADYLKDNMSAEVNSALGKYVKDIIDAQVTSKIVIDTVDKTIKQELSKFSVQDTVQYQAQATVKELLTKLDLPEKSIKSTSIDWKDFSFSAGMVSGKFKQLESNGLVDNAESTKLYITDDGVVADGVKTETLVTNSAQTGDLTVTGTSEFIDATFKGDVNIIGKLTTDSLAGLQEQLANTTAYTINGKTVLSEGALGNSIVQSNLRSVGVLQELQVSGEALIGDTLYVTPSSRVGINTDEPTHALSVWDSEVCLNMGKHSKDVAVIGTERNQDIMLKSGNNDNIVLKADGKTYIAQPVLNGKVHTNQPNAPLYAGKIGDICWNSDPKPGKSIGWVCLGNTQWCSFGNIA